MIERIIILKDNLFSSVKEGVGKEMYLLVVSDDYGEKHGPNATYIPVDFSDGEETKSINFFSETVDNLKSRGITKNNIIKGIVTKNNKRFYNLNNDWVVNNDPSVTIKDFIKIAPIDLDKSFEELIDIIKSEQNETQEQNEYHSLTDLTLKILQERKDKFKYSSAAINMHHNYIGGLLQHTLQMVRIAKEYCKVYDCLDEELLICGTALHDIGKIECYDTSDMGETTGTVDGRLLDHLLIAVMSIKEAAQKDKYNEEKVRLLMHLVASHHGKQEWGAIVTPAIPEATVLSLIDLADSRINMYEQVYLGQETDTVSKNKAKGLEESYIYKSPFYKGQKEDVIDEL